MCVCVFTTFYANVIKTRSNESMNKWLKAHRYTKVILCHKILQKSGPVSLRNNDKA